MDNHDASKQALGYLFQTQVALLQLLDAENSEIKICLEKFDDISFHKEFDPIMQLQVKYHSKVEKITNSSTDFWRTLKSWVDCINNNYCILSTAKFCILTTNEVAKDSVIEKIKTGVNPEIIYKELIEIAETGIENCKANSSTYKFYDSFLHFDEKLAKQLIGKIIISPNMSNPQEINNKILQKIRLFTVRETENVVFERLMGWWYQRCVTCLESEVPIFISFEELRKKINSITHELSDDNLPLDVTEKEIEAVRQEGDTHNIILQLELIDSKRNKINNALKNYYKAFAQRSKWIRENLVTPEEIDKYDEKLTEEWEYQFSERTDDISENTEEDDKIEMGKELYKTLMNQDIPIREKVDDMFISRGSFNSLANELKIGWHPDYYDRLNGEYKK